MPVFASGVVSVRVSDAAASASAALAACCASLQARNDFIAITPRIYYDRFPSSYADAYEGVALSLKWHSTGLLTGQSSSVNFQGGGESTAVDCEENLVPFLHVVLCEIDFVLDHFFAPFCAVCLSKSGRHSCSTRIAFAKSAPFKSDQSWNSPTTRATFARIVARSWPIVVCVRQ